MPVGEWVNPDQQKELQLLQAIQAQSADYHTPGVMGSLKRLFTSPPQYNGITVQPEGSGMYSPEYFIEQEKNRDYAKEAGLK